MWNKNNLKNQSDALTKIRSHTLLIGFGLLTFPIRFSAFYLSLFYRFILSKTGGNLISFPLFTFFIIGVESKRPPFFICSLWLKVKRSSSFVRIFPMDLTYLILTYDWVLSLCFALLLEGVKKSDGNFLETSMRVPAD